MPQTSPTKLAYAAPGDPASLVGVTKAVADSYRGPVTVTNSTAANQLLSDLSSLGKPATAADPVLVYRLDTQRLYVSTGGAFTTITPRAGRGLHEMDCGSVNLNHAGGGLQGVTANFNFTFSAAPIVTFSVGPSSAAHTYQVRSNASTTSVGLFVHATSAGTFTLNWMAMLR